MIQIVLMEEKDWINEHKSFKNHEGHALIDYLRLALNNPKHTTIQITKWDDRTGKRL